MLVKVCYRKLKTKVKHFETQLMELSIKTALICEADFTIYFALLTNGDHFAIQIKNANVYIPKNPKRRFLSISNWDSPKVEQMSGLKLQKEIYLILPIIIKIK